MRIYACGGTGINQAAKIKLSSIREGLVFADCSVSDFSYHPDADPKKFFAFKNVSRNAATEVDGSGKRRDANFEIIKPQMSNFFNEHPPEKFNVVICSDAGGTGVVIAHLGI